MHSKRRTNYYLYMKSTRWQETRKRFYSSRLWALQGKCCYACRVVGKTDLHHKTYTRLGKEKLRHLVALCRCCHELVHRIKSVGSLWNSAKKLRGIIKESCGDANKIESLVDSECKKNWERFERRQMLKDLASQHHRDKQEKKVTDKTSRLDT